MTAKDLGSIAELGRGLRARNVSSVDLVRASLQRIDDLNPSLNAFVSVYEDDALQAAEQRDRELRDGKDRGPLHGLPIAVKDNIDVAGEVTSACSSALRDNKATFDAECVKRLRQAGAVVVGKTNMHELAYGGTGEVSARGPARNPWDPKRNAGGSSSGSAVAVAAGMVPAALGTDTGGSVRIPAAACGIVGFKPTLGAISTQGVLPLSWTLDHVGVLTRTVEDAATLAVRLAELGWTSGRCLDWSPESRSPISTSAHEARRSIGVMRLPGFELEPAVQERFQEALEFLETIGDHIRVFDLQYSREAHLCWLGIMYPEAACRYESLLLRRYDEFAPAVRTQLEAGRHIRATTYLRAQRFRAFYASYFADLLQEFDILCMPTLPTVAPRIGQTEVHLPSGTVSAQDAMTFSNLTANMLGWPAISVPIGLTSSGLPSGLTLMRRAGQDRQLLTDAAAFVKASQTSVQSPQCDRPSDAPSPENGSC